MSGVCGRREDARQRADDEWRLTSQDGQRCERWTRMDEGRNEGQDERQNEATDDDGSQYGIQRAATARNEGQRGRAK